MSRAFSKVLVLVILIILVAGGFFAWQYFGSSENEMKDETADWQIYRNEEYGFEIKHPADTQIESNTEIDVLSNVPISMGLSIKPAGANGTLLINVIENASALDSSSFGPCFHTALGSDPESVTINGIQFFKWNVSRYLSAKTDVAGFGYEYCTAHNGSRYDLIPKISYVPGNPVYSIEPLFDQIISTFQFIDETADWQTYRNNEYGFEMKYPSVGNWKAEEGRLVNYDLSCDSSHDSGKGCEVDFVVEQNKGFSLDEWIEQKLYHLYFPRNEAQFTIAGMEGKKMEITILHSLKGTMVIFMKDDFVYRFTTTADGESILTQMLSTFKFLE